MTPQEEEELLEWADGRLCGMALPGDGVAMQRIYKAVDANRHRDKGAVRDAITRILYAHVALNSDLDTQGVA
jgi:hypothetical protein